MKTKFLFATACLALLFAACTKNVSEGDDSGIVTDPTGVAWVSFRVVTPTQPFTGLSRALNNPDVITGTEGETTVNSFIALFFTKHATPGQEVLTAVKTFSVGDDEFGNPNQPHGDAGDAFKVPATSKKVLIVANPSTKFKGLTLTPDATTFAQVNAVITGEVVSEIHTDGAFMMTNAKGGLEPSEPNGDPKDLVLYNSKSHAEAAPLSIAIDRVVAKVRVFVADGTGASEVASDYAMIYDPEWQLNVTNKKYSPVSTRVKTYMEGTGRGCITPFDQYRIGSYRVDPNYDATNQPARGETEITGLPGGFENVPQAYKDNYNYLSQLHATGWIAANTGANNDVLNKLQAFCLENTQIKAHNIWAYTTQVIFKAEFAPKGLKVPVLSNGGNGAVIAGSDYTGPGVVAGQVQQGQDWLMVNGGYYTWELLMQWMEMELTYKYKYDAVNQVPSGTNNTTLTNALNTYLADLKADYPALAAFPVTILDGNYNATAAQVTTSVSAIMDVFTAAAVKAAVVDKGSHRVGQVTYYKGGVSYYPIMVKHDDSETVMNEFGEFGVVRNSVYDIEITKVNKPGYPTIPQPNEPEGETPDEEEDNYLSVKIDVNPWTWYKQQTEL